MRHILLVEDSEGDILFINEALEASGLRYSISVVKDGQAALDYLFRNEQYTHAKIPDLILLDINLPLKSGHEILDIVKAEESIKHIPVIMLTTSSSQNDIRLSYEKHANCYITKPMEIGQFHDAIESIRHFWLQVVSLPNPEG